MKRDGKEVKWWVVIVSRGGQSKNRNPKTDMTVLMQEMGIHLSYISLKDMKLEY
jgi:hypothetical protein